MVYITGDSSSNNNIINTKFFRLPLDMKYSPKTKAVSTNPVLEPVESITTTNNSNKAILGYFRFPFRVFLKKSSTIVKPVQSRNANVF